MIDLDLFPMDRLQIRAPRKFTSPEEFVLSVKFENRSNEKFRSALSNFRDHKAHKKFALGLVWADQTWTVVYDPSLGWVDLTPGIVEAAYFAAKQGEYNFPVEMSPRESFSGDRNARV